MHGSLLEIGTICKGLGAKARESSVTSPNQRPNYQTKEEPQFSVSLLSEKRNYKKDVSATCLYSATMTSKQ